MSRFTTEGDYTIKQKPITAKGGGRRIGGITVDGDYTYTPQAVTRSGATGQVVSPKSGAQSTTGITAPKSTAYLPNAARRQEAAKAPYNREANTYGARSLMRAAGLDDNDIGYDGQYVTYKGNRMFIPDTVENGTSYASKPTIYGAINGAYAADGKKLVQANRYQNKYGITDGLGYNAATGEVTVGGVPIDYAYIDDGGNAWADESILSSAYDNYANSLGIREPGYYSREYNDEVKAGEERADAAVDELKNWKLTDEDIKNDPIYKAYAAEYLRDGAKAYKNTLAQLAAQTGGGLSSAAIAAAGAAQNEYMDALADRVPEIAQYAYERFRNGEMADIDEAARRREDAYNKYAVGYGENRDNLDRQEAESEAAYERFVKDIDLQKSREALRQEQYENLFARGQLAGGFTDEEKEAAGADNPYAGEAAYFDKVTRPQYEWQSELEDKYDEKKSKRDTANDAYLLGINNANDLAKLAAQNSYDMQQLDKKYQYENKAAYDDLLYDLLLQAQKKQSGDDWSGEDGDDDLMALALSGIASDPNTPEDTKSTIKDILWKMFGEGKE